LRARYGDKVRMPLIAPQAGLLASLLGRRSAGTGSLGMIEGATSWPDQVISALETRAIWAKFGL
jgi:hypothetical protein